ncbi:MFS transporter [Virgisporangium aurantiacum]|uniref:MFS transporter n=1 Tax=Virgisporangium aurantiacum TaxID=175570 RepID=UPI00194E7CA4|nr:MFS transporter [Virgisporangium aurantiacum]
MQFVVVLDATIVTTALPAIRSSLGFSDAGLTWVVTAYTLVFGALLVPAGRVADLLGPRRALVTGLGVFAAASAACAAAWTPAALIAARAVQGLGAALSAPAALALLGLVSHRGRAVGLWTAAGAVGGGSGWVVGGLVTDHLGWPVIFWINVPIGLVAIASALRVLPRVPARRRRIDVFGAVTITIALGLLVQLSWASLVAAAALIALFAWHLRRDADPLIPPRLLRSPTVAGANLTAALLTASTTPAMYLAMLHLQVVLLFPVFNVGVVAGSLVGPRAVRRTGHRRTAVAGFALIAFGAALLALFSGAAPPPSPGPGAAAPGLGAAAGFAIAVAFAVVGAGLGAASVASTRAGTEAARPEHRGVGSGVLTASAQIGTALGLAVLAAGSSVGSGVGFRVGLVGAAGVAVVGMVAALLLPGARFLPGARLRRADREVVGAGG